MRPLIGITADIQKAAFGAWVEESALVPTDYTRAVEAAGGRPLLVPPSDDGLEETLEVLDGLVLSGGSGLDPAGYGQEMHPETKGVIEERDRAELVLLHAALERDMPVLAVCRGSQILNVGLGGDLVQHLTSSADEHKHTPGEYADHDVTLEPGTVSRLLGDRAPVKSHHHQGIGKPLGEGFREAAHARRRHGRGARRPGSTGVRARSVSPAPGGR
jgi:gamma-glutamyl-gamma-aminobutyrate hydrolase PuuD